MKQPDDVFMKPPIREMNVARVAFREVGNAKAEIDDELKGVEIFTRAELVPIPAICKQGHPWVGRDAIRAPSLRNCCCFWCGSPLKPHPNYPPVVDALTRRLAERRLQPVQTAMAFGEER